MQQFTIVIAKTNSVLLENNTLSSESTRVFKRQKPQYSIDEISNATANTNMLKYFYGLIQLRLLGSKQKDSITPKRPININVIAKENVLPLLLILIDYSAVHTHHTLKPMRVWISHAKQCVQSAWLWGDQLVQGA